MEDTRTHNHCDLDGLPPFPPQPWGPRGIENTVMNGHIQSWLFGVAYNQGTVDSTVSDVVLSDYHRAGIVMYHNQSTEPSGNGCPAVWGSYDDAGTQVSNVFLEPENEGAGICDFTRSPTNSTTPACE